MLTRLTTINGITPNCSVALPERVLPSGRVGSTDVIYNKHYDNHHHEDENVADATFLAVAFKSEVKVDKVHALASSAGLAQTQVDRYFEKPTVP